MFTFHLLSDSFADSGVLPAKHQITTNEFYNYIESETYGDDLNGVAIILMCYEPEIQLKRRIRLSKKEKVLYMDIMLDFEKFRAMTHKQRINKICEVVLIEVPLVVKKYKLKDFDLNKLMNRLEFLFKKNNYIV